MTAELEFAHEVPFHDCDPMGIVWHGNYVRYFELARCALLETIGYNYDHMAESGYSWPVIDLQLRYIKPCVFKQKVVIHAKVVEWEYRLKIAYAIRDAVTGARLTKGHSVQVAVDVATQEMQLNSPRVLLQKLGVTA